MDLLNVSSKDFYHLSKNILAGGNICRFYARGNSMAPFVKDGDTLEVKYVDPQTIKRGDVIFYHSDHRLIAHRVIKIISKNGTPIFSTQADNGCGIEMVQGSQVLGRVMGRERKGRNIKLDTAFYRFSGLMFALIPFIIRRKGYQIWSTLKKFAVKTRFSKHDLLPAVRLKSTRNPIKKNTPGANFRKKDYFAAAQNIIAYKALEEVLRKFDGEQIKVILLTGAALAETVYDNISQRPMGDIDLLIRQEDFVKADKCLHRLEYNLESGSNAHYIKKTPPVSLLDIHTRIWYLDKSEIDNVWKNGRQIEISKHKTLVLAPEDMLIYAAAHPSVHHGHLKKTSLADIARILKTYGQEINWDRLIRKIKKYNLQIPLFYAFSYTCKFTQARISTRVLNAIRPTASTFLESKLYYLILNAKPIPDIGHLLRPLTQPGLKGKLKFLFKVFFPSRKFLIRRYNVSRHKFAFLFYLTRPVMHLWRGSKIGLQLLGRLAKTSSLTNTALTSRPGGPG